MQGAPRGVLLYTFRGETLAWYRQSGLMSFKGKIGFCYERVLEEGYAAEADPFVDLHWAEWIQRPYPFPGGTKLLVNFRPRRWLTLMQTETTVSATIWRPSSHDWRMDPVVKDDINFRIRRLQRWFRAHVRGRTLAVAMALHFRLGAQSGLALLGADLLRLVTHRCPPRPG